MNPCLSPPTQWRHAGRTAATLRAVAIGLAVVVGACFDDQPITPPTPDMGTTDSPGTSGRPAGTTDALDLTSTSSSSSIVDSSGTTSDSSTNGARSCLAQDCGLDPISGQPCGRCGGPSPQLLGCVEHGHWYCGERLGFGEVLPVEASVSPMHLAGFQVVLEQNRRLRALGVLAVGAGANIRMALYSGDGPSGGPNLRRALTGEVAVVGGYNEYQVEELEELEPGPYWVFIQTDDPAPLMYRSLNPVHPVALVPNVEFEPGAFPRTMTKVTPMETYGFTVYMVVQEL